MTDTELYRWGVPAAPDVELIEKRWPASNMEPGDVIKFKEIASVINVEIDSSRFQTVTNAWRKKLTPEILIHCPGDKTFVVATEPTKLSVAIKKCNSGIKSVRRSVIISSWIDPKQLNEDQRKKQTNLSSRLAAIKSAIQVRGNADTPPPSLLE
jgi:peroxiredoxin